VAIWKMLRKKGCVPSALTQNVKDFLAEAVNKRDGGIPEEQQPFAGIGMGHIGKLVGADPKLFG